jgi:hypothetical protein
VTDKLKRIIAGVAALAALALGGSAIAGATGGGQDSSKSPAADTEQGEARDSAATEDNEGAESGESEDGQSLNGPDADKARAAAEQATGGKAGEVQRDNAESEKDEGRDDDDGAQHGYQSPANAAYEVEVDKGGQEIEVYLDSNFQVLDAQVDQEQE